jgi:hypothetical protein
MKKVLLGMLFFVAFTISANAQEAKQAEAKPTAEKKACCASGTASKDAKACHTETASAATAQPAKGASCTAATTASASTTASTEAKAAPVTEEKKACSTGSSCCADKAKKV